MKRGSLDKLKESRWVNLKDYGSKQDVKIQLVPGGVRSKEQFGNDVLMCRTVFVAVTGFKNEAGEAVEDTLENRIDMYGNIQLRTLIENIVLDDHMLAFVGEGDAASD